MKTTEQRERIHRNKVKAFQSNPSSKKRRANGSLRPLSERLKGSELSERQAKTFDAPPRPKKVKRGPIRLFRDVVSDIFGTRPDSRDYRKKAAHRKTRRALVKTSRRQNR